MTLQEWFEQNKDKEIEFNGDSIKIKKTESKVWTPEYRDEYFYIDEGCDICNDQWFSEPNQQRQLQIGNVFELESDAEKAKEYLEFCQKIRGLGGRQSFDLEKANYSIDAVFRDSNGIKVVNLGILDKLYPEFGLFYFDSYDDAQNAIDVFGEEEFLKHMVNINERKNMVKSKEEGMKCIAAAKDIQVMCKKHFKKGGEGYPFCPYDDETGWDCTDCMMIQDHPRKWKVKAFEKDFKNNEL